MAGFENACFISYKHPPDADDAPAAEHFWMEFVAALETKLQRYVSLGLSVYRDDKLKLQPGIKYPHELSRRLCKSVCMVAVLVPEYLESSWCRAEWAAMEDLEAQRLGENKREGLIIPVLFRGDRKKAEAFVAPRVLLDFRHIQKPSTQLNTIASRQSLEDIGARINRFGRKLICDDCDQFLIDAEYEMVEPTFDDPNPMAN